MRRGIFKARVELLDDGKFKITPYLNRRVPFCREFCDLMKEAEQKKNGLHDWYQTYKRFTHEGVTYEQTDGVPCIDCVFHGLDPHHHTTCQHPHYWDGTRGICDGKIWKIKKTKK